MAKTQPPASPTVHHAGPKEPNRRRFPRRAKPFQGVYYTQPGERIPTVGLDISGGGLSLLLQHPIADLSKELVIGAVIENRAFSVVARVRWSDTIKVRGVEHYRYGVMISSISDADWDRLMHWTLQSSGELEEGAKLSAAQRDNLISPDVQLRIGDELVKLERLDPFTAPKLPLIEYHFVKYTMRQSTPYILIRVRSRVSDRIQHKINDHSTQILIGCDDHALRVLD